VTLDAIGHDGHRLIDPVTGRTVYVGKGVGNRACQHTADALGGATAMQCHPSDPPS
jgi:hypothetical protein